MSIIMEAEKKEMYKFERLFSFSENFFKAIIYIYIAKNSLLIYIYVYMNKLFLARFSNCYLSFTSRKLVLSEENIVSAQGK